MNTDLFKAILAMDAYNRGYGEGISGLGGINTQIGTVTIKYQSDTEDNDPSVAAGFYAIAYQDGGETIISYRGTDDVNSISDVFTSDDIWHGWLIGGGIQDTDQAALAFQFYNTIAGQGANITTLTGHSLGGGLAGLVGANTNNPVSKNLTFRKKCAA